MNVYDSLTKYVVYDFQLSYGGIGDCIKYFMFVLNICIKHNIKLYYLVNNLLIERYLRLRYEKMYITNADMSNKKLLSDPNQIYNISPHIFYIVNPIMFYNLFSYNDIHSIYETFTFTESVRNNVAHIFPHIPSNYISIHLRLGDQFLETDSSFVLCKDDARTYSEESIHKFIKKNSDKMIIFFCDNHSYKMKMKEQYSNIYVTNGDIGHTSLANTTDKQVMNTVTEFYIMIHSQEICAASYSGFSTIASKFNNVSLLTL